MTAIKRKVRAERTADVPPFNVMEVIAYLKEPCKEDCTKLSSDDLRTLSGNNWFNDKVNINHLKS